MLMKPQLPWFDLWSANATEWKHTFVTVANDSALNIL